METPRSNLSTECGCKGIRHCLVCEPEKERTSEKCDTFNFNENIYTYCPICNLFWSSETETSPLYLGNILVCNNFLTSSEEIDAVEAIDSFSWNPSQSGRRKQDFGPKVNFKKQKAKVGNFEGLPKFSKDIIAKFSNSNGLSDFKPVELCHLEYIPDRGSAIEPHIDDSWIWGERLVTVNLISSTTLTLTPATQNNCNCTKSMESLTDDSNRFSCNHKISVIDAACGKYRMNSSNVVLKINIPSRSLLVLGGCARYNWFHEIKRQDITERRLAMTFRELSENFLHGGSEEDLGVELLVKGNTFL